MEKISACLIVYNEEKLIERCLQSLEGAVDEIIVVHDGECQDKTLEIAEGYGAKIFIRPHVGACEGHRAFIYKQAKNDWILQIDADEFLSPDLAVALPELVQDIHINAYEFLWPLWNGKEERRGRWPYKRCLFRKSKASFLEILHFVVVVQGRVKKIDLKLSHRPEYNNYSYGSFLKKQLPWARLQANYYFKDFSTIEKYNYTALDWPLAVRFRKKFPILLMPVDFSITIIKNIFFGAYRAGYYGLRAALFAGIYRSAVNYYIYKQKK